MQIEPNVYLVGSGHLGFDLTDPGDCNIFLFDAGDTYVMFDAGGGRGTDQILAVCQRDGLEVKRIDHLFLTHAHGDHGGGAAPLHERIPLSVYAAASTAKIVSSGDEEAVSLPAARKAGIYPMDYVYRACPVAQVLAPNQVVEIGKLRIEVIPTPGHSHDHTSYLVSGAGEHLQGKRYLVGGDAIFWGGKIVWQHIYDFSVTESIATIQRLATYSFDALLPGHLNFSLKDGKRHIETACAIIDKLGCPPSIG